jgi:hypothetical protein
MAKKKYKLKCLSPEGSCEHGRGRSPTTCAFKGDCEWREKVKMMSITDVAKKQPAEIVHFTDEIGEQVCKYLAAGFSLRDIGKMQGMPSGSTVMRWVKDPTKDRFREQYVGSIEVRTILMVDEIGDIDDECIDRIMAESPDSRRAGAIVNAYSNKTGNMKWNASKYLPKLFGSDREGLGSAGNTYNVTVISSDTDAVKSVANAALRKIEIGNGLSA